MYSSEIFLFYKFAPRYNKNYGVNWAKKTTRISRSFMSALLLNKEWQILSFKQKFQLPLSNSNSNRRCISSRGSKRSLYDILNVKRTATQKELKVAYFREVSILAYLYMHACSYVW